MSSGLEERGVTPLHVLVASALAAFREEGVLNYALVTSSMQKAGERLALVYGRPPDPLEALRRAHELLQFAGGVEVEDRGGHYYVRVATRTCRVCPKAVGGLELPGRLCPLPGLLSGFAGLRPDLEGTRKDGTYCVIAIYKNPRD
ncbi:hypothetical protein IG193_07570 [Infirmifilum lucidum]|uniref:Uncharacterized protein n=1 Tax=Infirmifilum lucidum TaxID=2776706 RepID=A0A7L9FFY5_9CREN|nr:hypothetical protein [Infirmifilum lucidum]QOJ78607.1 hypothetical protein IG193_07570 [Infirmifilum lucidum]